MPKKQLKISATMLVAVMLTPLSAYSQQHAFGSQVSLFQGTMYERKMYHRAFGFNYHYQPIPYFSLEAFFLHGVWAHPLPTNKEKQRSELSQLNNAIGANAKLHLPLSDGNNLFIGFGNAAITTLLKGKSKVDNKKYTENTTVYTEVYAVGWQHKTRANNIVEMSVNVFPAYQQQGQEIQDYTQFNISWKHLF